MSEWFPEGKPRQRKDKAMGGLLPFHTRPQSRENGRAEHCKQSLLSAAEGLEGKADVYRKQLRHGREGDHPERPLTVRQTLGPGPGVL